MYHLPIRAPTVEQARRSDRSSACISQKLLQLRVLLFQSLQPFASENVHAADALCETECVRALQTCSNYVRNRTLRIVARY